MAVKVNKKEHKNILKQANSFYEFTKEIPFKTSFLTHLLRISAPDIPVEDENFTKILGENVLNYVNKEKVRITNLTKQQSDYYGS